MLQEAEKNVLAQKLLVFNAVASAGGNKEYIQQIITTWDRLLSLTYGVPIGKSESLTEKSMMDEYEKIKNLRPQFKLEKGGKISIKGFENFK